MILENDPERGIIFDILVRVVQSHLHVPEKMINLKDPLNRLWVLSDNCALTVFDHSAFRANILLMLVMIDSPADHYDISQKLENFLKKPIQERYVCLLLDATPFHYRIVTGFKQSCLNTSQKIQEGRSSVTGMKVSIITETMETLC